MSNPWVVENSLLGLPLPSLRFFRVLYRHLLSWKKYLIPSLIGTAGEGFLYLFSLGLGRAHYIGAVAGVPYIQYLAAGIWMSTAMYAATFEGTFGAFTRFHEQRLYNAILATPIQLEEIIAAEVAFGGVRGIVTSMIIMLIFLGFGLITTPWAILIIPLGLLTAMAFVSLALIWTSWTTWYDSFSYYFVLIITPMFLFSGIFFPLEHLPEYAGKIAWFTPLYHSVRASRELYQGSISGELLTSVAFLLLFTAICFYIALFSFRKRLLK